MGKNDRRTKRGKLYGHSHGKTRSRKKEKLRKLRRLHRLPAQTTAA